MNPFKLPGFLSPLYAPEGGGGGDSSPAPAPASSPAAPAPSSADSSGGGSAPASSPSGAAPSPAAESPTPLPEDPFSGFGAEDNDDEPLGALPPAKEKPAPAKEAKPADKQSPPAEAPKPAAEQQAAPPEQKPAETGPQEATPQSLSPAEPAKIGAAMLADIESLANHLAQTPEFRLSDEDLEALNTDIATSVPKLLARTFIRAQATAMNQMERVVPAMVERYMRVTEARTKSEGKFYSRWNTLNREAHGELVNRFAATYRKMNPSANIDQMIEEIGPMVMMAAKVQPPAAAAPNGSAPNGVRRPTSPPFQPAVGGPAAPPAPNADASPWEGYGKSLPDDE
jgi:hypothetical protein